MTDYKIVNGVEIPLTPEDILQREIDAEKAIEDRLDDEINQNESDLDTLDKKQYRSFKYKVLGTATEEDEKTFNDYETEIETKRAKVKELKAEKEKT